MEKTLILTPLYEQDENCWTNASIGEIPGVLTCTPPELDIREWLVDALREYCLACQDLGQPLPLGASSIDELVRALP